MDHANPKLSHLESLPTELLEEIFLECLNLNFPQASSHLGTVLASIPTRMAHVLKVFPAASLEHENELSQNFLAGCAGDRDSAIGELQSRILACRWMTWDFLKLCMEAFVVRTLLWEFRTRNLPWREGLPVPVQLHHAVKPPWHGGAPVKESVVPTFVHELFALKGSLDIRCQKDLCNCDYPDHQMRVSEHSDRRFQARANDSANSEEEGN